jgi:hypothetical protein
MNDQEINKRLEDRTPLNTRNSRVTAWKRFTTFLEETGEVFDDKWTDDQINQALKRFAFNIRKYNGEDYKDESLKSNWNCVAKQIMNQVYKGTGRNINIFKDPAFQEARDSKFMKRQELQKDPTKRKVSATPLTAEESQEIISVWGIDTPEGLNRTLFHLGGFALANRGNDQSSWRLENFEKEVDNKGQLTGYLFL